MTELARRYPWCCLGLMLLLQVLLHLPFLQLPPSSIHVWRQCNTLAVARNFFEEDNNILQPRVDRRFDTDGVTGMQFPAFEWGLAQLYRLTGEHYAVQRGYALAISVTALVFVFLFFRRYANDNLTGLLAAWMAGWSPEWFYHSINALPDVMAWMCGAGALAAFMQWRVHRSAAMAGLAVVLLTLAGLIKIQYGLFGMIMVVFVWQDVQQQRQRLRTAVSWCMAGLLSAVVVTGWYCYANALITQSGLNDFVLQLRPVDGGWQEAVDIFRRNLISDLPELLLNYAGLILLLTGLMAWYSVRVDRQWTATPAFLLFLVWYVLMLEQMKVHQYYLLPLLLLCLFPMLQGCRWLLHKNKPKVLYLLLLLMPVLAAVRIVPARWLKEDRGIPAAFTQPDGLKALIAAVPATDKVITVPDKSGCIWLYFLRKKGFSYEDASLFTSDTANGSSVLTEYKQRGARWVYMQDGLLAPDHPVLQAVLVRDTTIGGISVYRIN